MESTSSRVNVQSSRQSSKRLLFDRRYGWVIDEWKHPAEEALDGGRGMFCILPLAKRLVQMTSQSINLGVASAIKAAENPQTFSLQTLQSALDEGVRNLVTTLKIDKCKDFILNKNPSHFHGENKE
ncbi:uncharacterized protein LOC131631443 [Vicia villosa]|uniref:uncharacterized protein LOC131631443 n=1 Tax=Vicia villosa TaxID=3911 RepID=UPI00273AD9CB|nr:uncharacterized protein LOC131631443 [Vicia villosa]XP_058758220.1 uncharacterized protein LOC131631443 [Vicia villosa]XP_058758223.1 uncharacterized protein LOC131631443 [Vicia villosa]